jgi:hypothetical protein
MKKLYNALRLIIPMIIMLFSLSIFSQTSQYLHFDREDDFVKLDGASQYIANGAGISMTGWFFCDELGYGQGMMGFRTIGNGFYLIQLDNGKVECRLETANGLFEYVTPNNATIAGLWQHWAWVYDGTQVILYIDGTQIGSAAASGTFTYPDVAFAIGTSILSGLDFYYGGRIDEVSAWNIALSQSDIQDIMDNELEGNEPGLQLYYKFNQGDPGGNNTTITHAISEVDSPERDGELLNFALNGETSNFNGEVDPGYQAISFAQIPNHLTTDAPFTLEATATSGLDVEFEILSGPATIDGNVLTLTGEAGEVVVEATQPGNGTFDPAEPVQNTFMVVDPDMHAPVIEARNPLSGDVYVPELDYIQLASYVVIEYPELFNVTMVQFIVNGQILTATDWGEGYFSGWWAPPSYGNYSIEIIAFTNFGAFSNETVNINVVEDVTDMEAIAFEDIWVNTGAPTVQVDAFLPSFLGAFDQITATLTLSCPTGGCGEWDRVASIDARGHNGEWVEIIRYITPYGVPCAHTIDLTDYISILQGKISFRVNCGTFDNGYLWTLTLNYNEGSPDYKYSNVDVIWWDTYQFGDYEDLQPVEDYNFSFQENAQAATLKLVSSGHGWGTLNTGNAAEFHDDTHHIWVNGEQTFEQHNWADCDPNPDGCQPQNGTWYHNRAGWCPGSIAPWFDFNMSDFIIEGDVELGYVFDEDYIDYCHPNHPDCVTGVTCADCDDGFNPHLVVACNLIEFSDSPIDNGNIITVTGEYFDHNPAVHIFPNPADEFVELTSVGREIGDEFYIRIMDITGKKIEEFEWNGESKNLDLTHYQAGVYFFNVTINDTEKMFKVIVR